ncbi:MAG: IS66 family insertion sequence element accessory protein TnpB [Myxococcaceae bacterium]
MRRGFNGLGALVSEKLGRDVLAGELFLFVSRRRKRAKVLFWDGTGLVVYTKRNCSGPVPRYSNAAGRPGRRTQRASSCWSEGSPVSHNSSPVGFHARAESDPHLSNSTCAWPPRSTTTTRPENSPGKSYSIKATRSPAGATRGLSNSRVDE